jgi:molecular chaperone GrpE (heat shock protein)
MNPPNYLSRLCSALLGKPAQPAINESEAHKKLAALELDMADRDERITKMQAEYAVLQEEKKRAQEGAGGEQLERLFKKISGSLATLSTLAHAARAGQDVKARDIADLVVSLEKALAGFGLEAIGEPGLEMPFDVAAHQRMSGGAPHGGESVRVRLPGYRMGRKVLQKALVTGKGE